jgi:hypothetical protein
MGLDHEKRFHRYHLVSSRASWSSVKARRVLLRLLVEAFVPEGGPLVVGIDETLESRWGEKIAAKDVYRDPVRSTHETFLQRLWLETMDPIMHRATKTSSQRVSE